jgi:hypothetical protein
MMFGLVFLSNKAVYIPPCLLFTPTSLMYTPFLPALRRMVAPMGSGVRRARASAAALTLSRIEDHLGRAFDPELLQNSAAKEHSRRRLYSLACIFWSWIWQILQAGASCREAVRQRQALGVLRGRRPVSGGTAAYCRARGRLPLLWLQKMFAASVRAVEKVRGAAPVLLQGRRLKFVDASTVRLPDTPKNRTAYPSARHQGAGPGFPLLYLSVLFCAATGALLAVATGNCHQGEGRLFLSLCCHLLPGDILTGDRAYGSFVMTAWLQSRQVDLIARVSTGSRRVDFRRVLRKLAPADALFRWTKPGRPSALLTRAQWQALPPTLTVRILRRRMGKKGFRTKEITLVTTLTDPVLYPADELFAAYLLRWRLEMGFDDLKTTLGMESLSCRSPQLVERELLCYLTASNLLRWLMLQAARHTGVPLQRLSFKGTLDAFRQWCTAEVQLSGPHKRSRQRRLRRSFLDAVGADIVPERPGRREPRAVKKRSKYDALNKPRHLYRERPGRNQRRIRARAKKKSLTENVLLK